MEYLKRLLGHNNGNDSDDQPLRSQSDLHRHGRQRNTSPVAAWTGPVVPPASPQQLVKRSHSRHRQRSHQDQPSHRSQRYWAPPPSPQHAPKRAYRQISRDTGYATGRAHTTGPHHRHTSRRKHALGPTKMPADHFSGPSCKDLVEFMKSVKDIPSKHKANFDDLSAKAIEAVCDADALHVWESGDDVDDLLQLTQVIVKLRKVVEDQEGRRRKEAAMVIVSSERAPAKDSRDGFERICNLVRHLTESDGKKHLNGTIHAFDAIVVVRGIDYTSPDDEAAVVKRINTAIERVFRMQRLSTKQLVWHHGAIISLLLTWINTTTSDLRSSLTAISITAALDLADGVKPSPLGKANKPADLQRLGEYATKLSVPVVYVDPASQLITYEYLATYMYYWAFYIHTFLPTSVLRPHFYKALDDLVTFAFRLRGACDTEYTTSTVRLVQEHLSAANARRWAQACIDPGSYTRDLCRSAGAEAAIHHAVQLSDSPFAPFAQVPGYPLPAFSRLPLCPSQSPGTSTGANYLAAPVSFNFRSYSFRATSSTPFYILLPREGQDVEKVTARIQGTMMGVLERIRGRKGNPELARQEKEYWTEVKGACLWAIEGCKGRCPEGVEEKVKFVREKFANGTWNFLCEGKSGAQGQQQQQQQQGRMLWDWAAGQNEQSGGWGGQVGQNAPGWQSGAAAGTAWG